MARQRIEAPGEAAQEQEAQRIYERLASAFGPERMRIARLLASKALEVAAEKRVKKAPAT